MSDVRFVGAADIMSNPPRFSRGYAMGGKVHAVTWVAKSTTEITVRTACGRFGAAAGLWGADSWPTIAETPEACANCARKTETTRKEES